MSRFSADWLRLRAPFDAAARASPLARAIAERFCAALEAAGGRPVRIADLGGGSGANVGFLSPLLRDEPRWTVFDHDADLLAPAMAPTPATLSARHLDLADLSKVEFEAFDAVTGSAFLDLASAAWIDDLVSRCAAAQCAVYFALSVDGRVGWTPQDADDGLVLAGFRRDQARDKGLGPALGPDAGRHLARCLAEAGAAVTTAPSDWRVNEAARPMLGAMVAGLAGTPPEAEMSDRARVEDWAARRRRQLSDGQLSLRIGHIDVAGVW